MTFTTPQLKALYDLALEEQCRNYDPDLPFDQQTERFREISELAVDVLYVLTRRENP